MTFPLPGFTRRQPLDGEGMTMSRHLIVCQKQDVQTDLQATDAKGRGR